MQANIAWVERVKALLQPLTQLYYSNMVMYTGVKCILPATAY